MWKRIEVVVLEYWSSVSWSGILTHVNLAQNHNKYFQCVNAWSECGHAHIFDSAISDALA